MATVSIHPYFKVKEGKMEAIKAICAQMVPMCQAEKNCTYFGFTFDGDNMYCREAYEGAQGVFEHLENTSEVIGGIFENADLVRIELHGAAEDIDKLREPLKDLNPTYYILELGD